MMTPALLFTLTIPPVDSAAGVRGAADNADTSEKSADQPPSAFPTDDGPAIPLGTMSLQDIEHINNRWSGIGVGYDNGLWGNEFGQTLKVSIPFGKNLGRFMGLRLRGGLIHHNDDLNDQFDPVVNVGAELFGRGPVWNGMLRVYGGGGLWAGIRPNPTSVGQKVALGGGGHFGLEVLAAPFMSFTFEIGGQSPAHDLGHDGGASAMGGVMFYFGRQDRK